MWGRGLGFLCGVVLRLIGIRVLDCRWCLGGDYVCRLYNCFLDIVVFYCYYFGYICTLVVDLLALGFGVGELFVVVGLVLGFGELLFEGLVGGLIRVLMCFFVT